MASNLSVALQVRSLCITVHLRTFLNWGCQIQPGIFCIQTTGLLRWSTILPPYVVQQPTNHWPSTLLPALPQAHSRAGKPQLASLSVTSGQGSQSLPPQYPLAHQQYGFHQLTWLSHINHHIYGKQDFLPAAHPFLPPVAACQPRAGICHIEECVYLTEKY